MSQRFALVTGTSSGIGAAVSRELLARGWQVFGIARRAAKIEDKRYRHLALDLSDIAKAAPKIEREVGARLGEPWERGGLVNNAAAGLSGRIQDLAADELRRPFGLHTGLPIWLMGFMFKRVKTPVRVGNLSSC